MKETEQTLLDQIKNDVAKEKGFPLGWIELEVDYQGYSQYDECWIIVCERYYQAKAKASCEATLKKASENARTKFINGNTKTDNSRIEEVIDKSSINNLSNIVIL